MDGVRAGGRVGRVGDGGGGEDGPQLALVDAAEHAMEEKDLTA